MRFDAPFVLWVAPLVALIFGGVALWARIARIRRARAWSLDLAAQARGSSRWSPVLLGVTAGTAMLALAGPRWGTRVVETETKGLNLVIAVDVSRSMLAEDVPPSRLERAQRFARRLIQDLDGDRIGLVAFADQAYVLSPLTIDHSALLLLVDALHPSLVSSGGTSFAGPLRVGHALLLSGDQIADRVMVIFSDGESHDSSEAFLDGAARLRRSGIRLIVVGEGTPDPTTIPVRDADGTFLGYQRDPTDEIVQTRLRNDILGQLADAAEGVVVAAEHGDQAAVLRDLIRAYKRSPQATSTSASDVARAWIPLLVATMLLLLHTFTRRTLALASLALALHVSHGEAQGPRNPAMVAWERGDSARALRLSVQAALSGAGGDTAWFNAGSLALAISDTGMARDALTRAANAVDPAIRFRALYNLGLMYLETAVRDSANARTLLERAQLAYREALLLRPGHHDAKWNLELALRRMPPPEAAGPPPPSPSSPDQPNPQREGSGLSQAQAEQILNSIAEEERRTRTRLSQRDGDARTARGRKEW